VVAAHQGLGDEAFRGMIVVSLPERAPTPIPSPRGGTPEPAAACVRDRGEEKVLRVMITPAVRPARRRPYRASRPHEGAGRSQTGDICASLPPRGGGMARGGLEWRGVAEHQAFAAAAVHWVSWVFFWVTP